MRVPLAGGTQETLLSEVGPYLLCFVSTHDARALRRVCREFLAAVTEHPWEDMRTVITGSIRKWRACFPRALRACVTMEPPFCGTRKWRTAQVVDADFVHLEGLLELDMSGCQDVTDAAFAHLRGVRSLNMRFTGAGITDAAFAPLRGIHTLDMSGCSQASISDAAFAHLRGIHTLKVMGCNQASITSAAFAPLRGVRTLDMHGCNLAVIAAARAQGLPVTDFT
jgi:hypothetical protein